MTPKQKEYLTAMNEFYYYNHQLPPVDKLAEIMGVHPNAAHEALKRLERAGAIKRNSCNKWMFAK